MLHWNDQNALIFKIYLVELKIQPETLGLEVQFTNVCYCDNKICMDSGVSMPFTMQHAPGV